MATTAKFPTALLALVDVGGELPGFPEATLSGAHNNSVTTITLTATVPVAWPTTGGWVTIDSEIIQYAAVSGATLTGCTRGSQSAYGGSVAASHADQAKVGFYLTPQAVNQIIRDLIAVETVLGTRATIASAATTDLSTLTAKYVQVTGTTTVTALGTLPAGIEKTLEFSGILTLTHNGTTLILRGAANATTAAGDVYAFVSEGAGNWRELFHNTAAAAGSSTVNNITTPHLFDDFIIGWASGLSLIGGDLGWAGLNAGGTNTWIAGVANHPGIMRLDTTTGANNGAGLTSYGTAIASIVPADTFDMTWIVRPSSTVDSSMVFRFGLVDTYPTGFTAVPTNGIYVEKVSVDTSYFGVTRSAGTQTRTAALGTVTNGTWVKIRIRRIDASTIGFTLDAGTELTLTTNIPTAGLFLAISIGNNAVGVSRVLDLDLFDMTMTGLTR